MYKTNKPRELSHLSLKPYVGFSPVIHFLPNYSFKAHPLKQQFQQQALAVIRGRRLWSPAGCEIPQDPSGHSSQTGGRRDQSHKTAVTRSHLDHSHQQPLKPTTSSAGQRLGDSSSPHLRTAPGQGPWDGLNITVAACLPS